MAAKHEKTTRRLPRCAKCGECIRGDQYLVYPGETSSDGRQLGRHVVCPAPRGYTF